MSVLSNKYIIDPLTKAVEKREAQLKCWSRDKKRQPLQFLCDSVIILRAALRGTLGLLTNCQSKVTL